MPLLYFGCVLLFVFVTYTTTWVRELLVAGRPPSRIDETGDL
ncbi:hypothetical protein [Aureimonas leprariae]|nr:hypothetical protein [Aureimonas leprariae]